MGGRLKQLLAQGKLVKVFGLGQLCHPKIVEIIGQDGGFDAVWLDQEHAASASPRSSTPASPHAPAASTRSSGSPHGLRDGDAAAGGRRRRRDGRPGPQRRPGPRRGPLGPLSSGRPARRQRHGVDGRYGTMPMPAYFAKASARTFVAIQIEHIDAVHDVEAIAAIPGVDVLFIGPADLGQSIGLVGQWTTPPCGRRSRAWPAPPPSTASTGRSSPAIRRTPAAAWSWAARCSRSASTCGPCSAAWRHFWRSSGSKVQSILDRIIGILIEMWLTEREQAERRRMVGCAVFVVVLFAISAGILAYFLSSW